MFLFCASVYLSVKDPESRVESIAQFKRAVGLKSKTNFKLAFRQNIYSKGIIIVRLQLAFAYSFIKNAVKLTRAEILPKFVTT